MNHTHRAIRTAAAALTFLLSLFVAPAALAGPLEGDRTSLSTAEVVPAPGFEHNKAYLEYLDRQQIAAQTAATDPAAIEPAPGFEHNKAYLEHLDKQQAAAQTTTADSAAIEPAPGFEHNKAYLEYLDERLAAARAATADPAEAKRLKAYIEYLERQQAAAEAANDGPGAGWLLGTGIVTVVVIGSVVLATIRSRRPEAAEPAAPDHEKLPV